MTERGTCKKHGEFVLIEGCRECLVEKTFKPTTTSEASDQTSSAASEIVEAKPTKCPLCDESMFFQPLGSDYHYWCEPCKHGWYVSDIMRFAGMALMGKSKEQIREFILKADKEG